MSSMGQFRLMLGQIEKKGINHRNILNTSWLENFSAWPGSDDELDIIDTSFILS